MPALALRFLAAAAFAYVAGSLVTVSRTRWFESELLISTVDFYGWPLLLAILIDAGQIDWSKPISWAFVMVVAPALTISTIYLFTNRRRAANEPKIPLNNIFKAFLGILGLASLAVGLLVFIVPKQAGILWPWAEPAAWKQLDSRLIASMLLTIAAAFMVIWRNDKGAAGVFMAMLAAYCVVAGIGVGLHAAATPAFVTQDLIYIGIFAVVLVAGRLLYLLPGPRQGNFNSASNRRG